MYLVKDPASACFVFTTENPGTDGFLGPVEANVTLEPCESLWPQGQKSPESCLGRSRSDPKHYRGFRFSEDCKKAGFDVVGVLFTDDFETWADYQSTLKKPK